jgi:uncharacterized DUF497 family protein
VRFTWNAQKAAANARKHHVTFEEAMSVFLDPLALVTGDPVHAERSLIIGESVRQRLLLTVFIERAEDEIRLISARRATNRERRNYESR